MFTAVATDAGGRGRVEHDISEAAALPDARPASSEERWWRVRGQAVAFGRAAAVRNRSDPTRTGQ
jgi:hypothetical protein